MNRQGQGRFLNVDNPIEERLGRTFFDELPKVPGVYKMYSREGHLLYVGKAKNLRTRLFSYRRAKSASASKKVMRLVCMVHSIEYECCSSEKDALLLENKLIREHQPGFNVAKKKPHTYYYLYVKPEQFGLSFRLSMTLEEDFDESYIFGAFKGHKIVRRGTGALLRELYLLEYGIDSVFDFPGILLRKLTPLKYDLKAESGLSTNKDFTEKLFRFLRGSSLDLMSLLVHSVNKRGLLQDFLGRMILKDFEALKYFYDCCSHRNHKLVKTLNLPSHIIPQQKLDDYLVQAAFSD